MKKIFLYAYDHINLGDDLFIETIANRYPALVEFESAIESGDNAAIADSDMEFHDIIFDATGNPRLIQIIGNLREQFYRYRLEYVKDTDYHIVLLNEHKELVNAIRAGKKEEARKIMKKHITNQEMTVIRNIKEEY